MLAGYGAHAEEGAEVPATSFAEVEFTRYRGGNKGNYTTRLHYTSDWIFDNEQKGVVKNLTPDLPGAEPFTQKVGIMSEHPEKYEQLAAHPELLQDIRLMEDRVNERSIKYLPMDKLADDEHLLQTGDIVGVTTTAEGIDVAHTGLCIADEQGVIHFMDASSSPSRMRVTVEPQISTCLNWSHRLSGVMIARPLEVRDSRRLLCVVGHRPASTVPAGRRRPGYDAGRGAGPQPVFGFDSRPDGGSHGHLQRV